MSLCSKYLTSYSLVGIFGNNLIVEIPNSSIKINTYSISVSFFFYKDPLFYLRKNTARDRKSGGEENTLARNRSRQNTPINIIRYRGRTKEIIQGAISTNGAGEFSDVRNLCVTTTEYRTRDNVQNLVILGKQEKPLLNL